eukprot:gene10337-biopygen247
MPALSHSSAPYASWRKHAVQTHTCPVLPAASNIPCGGGVSRWSVGEHLVPGGPPRPQPLHPSARAHRHGPDLPCLASLLDTAAGADPAAAGSSPRPRGTNPEPRPAPNVSRPVLFVQGSLHHPTG